MTKTENETPMTKYLNHPDMVEVFDIDLKKGNEMVELMTPNEAKEVSSATKVYTLYRV